MTRKYAQTDQRKLHGPCFAIRIDSNKELFQLMMLAEQELDSQISLLTALLPYRLNFYVVSNVLVEGLISGLSKNRDLQNICATGEIFCNHFVKL